MKKITLTLMSLVIGLSIVGCPSPRKTTNGTFHQVGLTEVLPAMFKWDFKKGESVLNVYNADGRTSRFSYTFNFDADGLIISKVEDKVLYTSDFLTASENESVQVLVSLWESTVEKPEAAGISTYDKYKVEVRLYRDRTYRGTYQGEYLQFKEYKERKTRKGKLKDPHEDLPPGRFGRPRYNEPVH